MNTWKECKKVLCVRPDNMGDVLMSGPAILALKDTFGCSITLLTSTMGKSIARYLPAVDDVIVWDVPWVKGTDIARADAFFDIMEILKKQQFDGAVIFTVFSQNPLPAALLLTMAGIPRRLGYCRENPYQLLSDWIPEEEPYNYLRHQVRRDLDLVSCIGARPSDERITIRLPENQEDSLTIKLYAAGVDVLKPWLILHPGVSETKREYPPASWIEAGRQIVRELDYQIIITGIASEKGLAERICSGIGDNAYSLAGSLSLEQFITLIRLSPLLISVNTGSIHIAAAVQTKVIVLYALTNPQHTPWKSIGKVLPFSVRENLQSKNQVLRYVQKQLFHETTLTVTPQEIFLAAYNLLINKSEPKIEELIVSSENVPSWKQENSKFP